MSNNSYITVLSTENYLQGVLVLAESLKATRTKYPLTVIVSDNISSKTEEIIKSFQLNVIRKKGFPIPEEIKRKNEKGNFPHWSNTFDKLLLFELTQFDKLVYLDSDMYVRGNIDELFEKENMSATIDRRCGPLISNDWIKLTSGIMVIEPKKDTTSKLLCIFPVANSKRESIGDQDILQEYDENWSQKENLHLDVKYNMFFPHVDYYTHYEGYHLKDIKVIHFIYTKKPFYLEKTQMAEYMEYIEDIKKSNYENYKLPYLKDYICCGTKDEEKIIYEYFEILEQVRTQL